MSIFVISWSLLFISQTVILEQLILCLCHPMSSGRWNPAVWVGRCPGAHRLQGSVGCQKFQACDELYVTDTHSVVEQIALRILKNKIKNILQIAKLREIKMNKFLIIIRTYHAIGNIFSVRQKIGSDVIFHIHTESRNICTL